MPHLAKRHISQFVRRSCKRRLRFDLYSGDPQHEVLMGENGEIEPNPPPKRELNRPGLPLLAEEGRRSEQERYQELAEIFPTLTSRPDKDDKRAKTRTGDSQRHFRLVDVWQDILKAPAFLIETEYAVPDEFKDALGLDELLGHVLGNRPIRQVLTLGNARPDILQGMPPAVVGAEGDPDKPVLAILPSGETQQIAEGDRRVGIRVIDCKLADEASEAHFAEIAYYCMTLAAWLDATADADGRPLSERLFVRADSAVWPGRHGSSSMVKLRDRAAKDNVDPELQDNLAAFEEDLEYLPVAVFVARVRRFFRKDMADALTPVDWRDVDYHVDTRCVGCEYLGHHWGKNHEDDPDAAPASDDARKARLRYCKPAARDNQHLSRLPGLTVGARRMLEEQGINRVNDLMERDVRDPCFDVHSTLKGLRHLVHDRARVLGTRAAALVEAAGGTAILPKWVDIKIDVIVEYDPASGLTAAFGHKVSFFNQHKGNDQQDWEGVEIVPRKSVEDERNALMAMLTAIHANLNKARALPWGFDYRGQPKGPTAQVYFWDRLAYEHLRRVVGRHLAALIETQHLRDLAWLFPPEQVVPDPESLSLQSPVSIVSEAFRNLASVDSPHFYSLLDCARMYHPAWVANYGGERRFQVHALYADPLTDYVPVERVHELWQDQATVVAKNLARIARNKLTPHSYRAIPMPTAVANHLQNTVKAKLRALAAVRERLTTEMRPKLSASAPKLSSMIDRTAVEAGLSADALVWLEHRRLQACADAFENDMLRAMTSEQREARFASARLNRLLEGPERSDALATLGLGPDPRRMVFELAPGSRDAKVKKGMGWSLLPEELLPLQYATLHQISNPRPEWEHLVPTQFRQLTFSSQWERLYRAAKASIAGVDRANRLIAIDADDWSLAGGIPFLLAAQRTGFMRFPGRENAPEQEWAILDPVVNDFATKRIKAALKGLGNPPLANAAPRVGFAKLPDTIRPTAGARGPRRTPSNPVEPFIWDAHALSLASSRFDWRQGFENPATGAPALTPRQAEALQNSLSHRLSLIWGPPGTGKSLTCRSLLACLAEWAFVNRRPVRMLITGPTWTAIDNVAKGMPEILGRLAADDRFSIHRLKSSSADESSVAPELAQFVTNTMERDNRFQELIVELGRDEGVTLVAATPHQVAKMLKESGLSDEDALRADAFDFVLIDEASQLDVAHAAMAYAALAPECCVVVVGDDKQMPPIQPVPAPDGLESMVGSIYDYYRSYQPVPVDRVMLNLNYRSNQDIVEFVKAAGYEEDFASNFPYQRLQLIGAAPEATAPPSAWPVDLGWSPEWERLLDPAEPLVAVLHDNETASQSNVEEAHAVAALVASLWGRLGGMTDGRPDDLGNGSPLDLETFLRRGIGVVTPHRAQQATIISMLERVLPRQPGFENLYEAVDTVERFQGQERMVMIASLGLGDLDQIRGEEDFLYSLNRFNVIASRAQAKFILLASRSLIDHIPSDPDMMRQSGLIKHFADGFLRQVRRTDLPRMGGVEIRTRLRAS